MTASMPVPAVPQAAPAAQVPLRWLWGAIGVLALSVAALATTLVLQQRPDAALADATVSLAAGRAADEGATAVLQPSPAPATTAAAATAVPPAPAVRHAAAPRPAPAAPQAPVAGAAPAATAPAPQAVCTTCGRVEWVRAEQQAAPATGVGAVAGSVLGAVVGNQVGKGSGRTAATLLGAVGGGYVGHQVEQRSRTQTVYRMAVRMDDGSVREFTRSQPYAVGAAVRVDSQGLRLAPEASPAAVPGTVRTGHAPA